jgi:Uma2 family endonuclease
VSNAGATRVEPVLAVMVPTGGETGARNFKIASRLDAWAEGDGSGEI